MPVFKKNPHVAAGHRPMPSLSRALLALFPILLSGLIFPQAVLAHETAPADRAVRIVRNRAPFQASAEWLEEQNRTSDTLRFTDAFPERQWWEQFHDPALSRYIMAGITENHDLQQAAARIAEARALTMVSLGEELPTLMVSPQFMRERLSKNLLISPLMQSSNSASGLNNSAANQIFAPGKTINLYSAPLQAGYEVDYLLKNRNKTQAAKQELFAQEQNRHALMLSLESDIAGNYFNLLKADALLNLQQQLIASRQDNLALIQDRYQAGLASLLDVQNAEISRTQAEAALPDYQAQRALASHKLAILLGQTPGQFDPGPYGALSAIDLPASVNSGIPTRLLDRRPDILQAQAELIKSHLNVTIARKDLLPTFNLNGQFGYTATALKHLFSVDSILASVAGGVTQTLFDGGGRLANVHVYKARERQQAEQYQQTVLNAFQEVEDSLANLKSSRAAYLAQSEALNENQSKVRLLQDKYDSGLIAYPDVLQVQQDGLTLAQSQLQKKVDCLMNVLSLYKALGGGF